LYANRVKAVSKKRPLSNRLLQHSRMWNIRGYVFLLLFLALPFFYLYFGFEHIWILFIAIVMLFSAFFVLPYYKQRALMADVQQRRDEQASAILAAVCGGQKADEFILFLRPFSSTAQLGLSQQKRRNEQQALWDSSNSDAQSQLPAELSHGDFESLLTDEFWPPVILGLDKPGEHFGASRLPIDEQDWQNIVLKLMQSASTLIVIPSTHAGTLWELEQIVARNYIHKCIFFIEPASAENEGDWFQARCALTELGFFLPAVFQNDNDKRYIGSLVKCVSETEACIRMDVGYTLELSATKTKLTGDMLTSMCSQAGHALLLNQLQQADNQEAFISLCNGKQVGVQICRN